MPFIAHRLDSAIGSNRVVSLSGITQWYPLFITVILLGGFVATSPAHGQESSTLRVLVTAEEDGRLVGGATIILDDTTGEIAASGVTNADGFHEMRGIVPGSYTLTASHVGYAPSETELQLAPGTRTVQIALASDDEMLGELLVEAAGTAARLDAGLQTITRADLARIPTPGPSGDLATYLQTLPGVVSAGDRGGEFFIRGGTPSQNLTRVDDLALIKPFHISNLFSAFPEEVIRDVEMYAGGFGAQYMGATSSVLDINLRRGNMNTYDGSAAVSPYLGAVHVEGPVEQGSQSFLASLRHSAIEQFGPPLTGEPVPMRFYDVIARYSAQLSNATCNVTAMHTDDQGQIIPARDIALSWTNLTVGGRCLMFGDQLDHAYDLSAGYTRFSNRSGTHTLRDRTAGVQKLYFSLSREHDIGPLPIDYGIRWTTHHYFADLQQKFGSLDSFDEYNAALQAYLASEIHLTDRLMVEPGIGMQITARRFQSPSVEPRLRLTYEADLAADQRISVALGKYNQMAEAITDERDIGTVFNIWAPTEVGDPLAEARHVILGYSQRIGSHLEFGIEGYGKQLRNIPVSEWTPETQVTLRTALAHGHTYGLDLRLTAHTSSFYGYLGYGLAKVEYEAASDDLGAWINEPVFNYAPAHDRRHQLNAIILYDIGAFTSSLRWELGSGQPYTRVFGFDQIVDIPDEHPTVDEGRPLTLYNEPYGARLPAYHRLDIAVERTFDLSPILALDAEVGAINLYNRANILSYDIQTFTRVDQMPLLPYLSLQLSYH